MIKFELNKNYKEVKLSDIFEFCTGNCKYTKSFIVDKKGIYPLYSSSTSGDGLAGYLDRYDFDTKGEKWLTWSSVGFHAGRVFIRTGKFNITNNCGLLRPNKNFDSQISMEYVAHFLGNVFPLIAIGTTQKRINISMVRNISIKIPTKPDGSFDLEVQKRIAYKCQIIREFKGRMRENLKSLKKKIVSIPNFQEFFSESSYKKVAVKDLFEFIKGSNKYSKKFLFKNAGTLFPVYSSSILNDGIVGFLDEADYDTQGESWLTWTLDGHAGRVFIRTGKFSMTNHCALMKPRESFDSKIDIEYIAISLNQILPKKALGNQNKRVTMGIIKSTYVYIPTKSDGSYDLEKQREIVQKDKLLNETKIQTLSLLKKAVNSFVKINPIISQQ